MVRKHIEEKQYKRESHIEKELFRENNYRGRHI